MPSPVLSFILSNRALIADGLKAVRDWPKGRSQGGSMSEHVYKQIELTGSSKTGVEAAVQNAIAKASKTLHNLHWFQVVDTRGYVEQGKVDYWQVTIKLGFRVDDTTSL